MYTQTDSVGQVSCTSFVTLLHTRYKQTVLPVNTLNTHAERTQNWHW